MYVISNYTDKMITHRDNFKDSDFFLVHACYHGTARNSLVTNVNTHGQSFEVQCSTIYTFTLVSWTGIHNPCR
jgi:hypothetical protein